MRDYFFPPPRMKRVLCDGAADGEQLSPFQENVFPHPKFHFQYKPAPFPQNHHPPPQLPGVGQNQPCGELGLLPPSNVQILFNAGFARKTSPPRTPPSITGEAGAEGPLARGATTGKPAEAEAGKAGLGLPPPHCARSPPDEAPGPPRLHTRRSRPG